MRAIALLALIACLWPAWLPAQTQPTHGDLTYATVGGRALQLDLYRPASLPTPAPLVVWVHGGGWSGGSRFPAQSAAELNARGIAVASISYRLTSQAGQFGDQQVSFPAQIHDVKAAVRWLRANAASYGLHPGRIGAWGSSAGGHLVALLGTSGDVGLIEGAVGVADGHSSRVQAVVDYYGPTDILQMVPDGGSATHDAFNSPESVLLGFNAADQGIGVLRAQAGNSANPYPLYRELARQLNPVTWVEASDPPFLIVHGTADPVVPIGQSRRLRDALQAAGRSVQMIEVPGGAHGGFPADVQRQAQDFLVAQLTAAVPVGNPAALSGSWYDPAKDGEGFTLQWQPDGRLLVYFYGYRDDRSNLNLVGVATATPRYGETLRVELVRFSSGRFSDYDPALVQRAAWGRVDLSFSDCDRIGARLEGSDGTQTLSLVRVARVGGLRCD